MNHSHRHPSPNPYFNPTVYMLGVYVPQELFIQYAEPTPLSESDSAEEDPNGEDPNSTEDSNTSWLGVAIVSLVLMLSGFAFTYGAVQFSESWVSGVESLVSEQESHKNHLY